MPMPTFPFKLKLDNIFAERLKFSMKEKAAVGLDIGSNSIKAIDIELRDKEILLKRFNLIEISLAADLPLAIKNCLAPFGIKDERINVSLTGQSVVTRYVWLPMMSSGELNSSLKFEAAKLIPFSIEEVNLDSYILKQDQPNNKMLVLIAAAKKEAVSERIKLVQNLGFKIGILDIDSLALINIFNFIYHAAKENNYPKAIALLNMGASVSNLNILEDGIPVFSRDIYIAGNHLTKRIADALGVNFEKAEELKINPEKEKQDKITSSADSVISRLASEIRISFDYYESQGPSTVAKILLTGGGSLFHKLKDNLSQMLGIDIDHWHPAEGLTFSGEQNVEKIKQHKGKFAVALGLAMRK